MIFNMAKRGTFGGSRFGSPSYGRAGFKRGFGRASFGRKGAMFEEGGIAKEMMNFFKQMQSGGPQPGRGNQGTGGGRPSRTLPLPVIKIMPMPERIMPAPAPQAPNKPGSPAAKPKVAPTGTPKTTPVKFRPKVLKLGR